MNANNSTCIYNNNSNSNNDKVIENNNNKINIDMRKWHWPQYWKGPMSRTSHSSWSACGRSKIMNCMHELQGHFLDHLLVLAIIMHLPRFAMLALLAHFRALIRSLVQSPAPKHMRKWFMTMNWMSKKSECIADRLVDQPTNQLTNRQPTNKRIDMVE